MPLLSDWQALRQISEAKRQAEGPQWGLDKKDRKAERVEAEALARQENQQHWKLRAQATQFLKEHGYTSGGKKRGARRIPRL